MRRDCTPCAECQSAMFNLHPSIVPSFALRHCIPPRIPTSDLDVLCLPSSRTSDATAVCTKAPRACDEMHFSSRDQFVIWNGSVPELSVPYRPPPPLADYDPSDQTQRIACLEPTCTYDLGLRSLHQHETHNCIAEFAACAKKSSREHTMPANMIASSRYSTVSLSAIYAMFQASLDCQNHRFKYARWH